MEKIRPPVYSATDRNGATRGTAETSTGEANAVTERIGLVAGKSFEVLIQLGAVLAIITVYFRHVAGSSYE